MRIRKPLTMCSRRHPEVSCRHALFATATWNGRRGRSARAAFLIGALAWALGGSAAPYLPALDSEVLEHVATRSDLDRLEPLRRQLASNPRNLPVALALARSLLQMGRAAGDPRFTAYAEAALLPWMGDAGAPEPVLVLQATALQNRHQFAPAMTLLDRAAELEPRDPQVWLTRAAIYALHHNVPETRRACARLVRTADSLVALTCLAGIDSRNGQLRASYDALRRIYGDDPRLPAPLRVWVLTQLADMAERLGDDRTAEQYFLAALRVSPDDSFSLAAYADLLIRGDRNAATIALLKDRESQDNLLLRLSVAGCRLGSADGTRWASLYDARVQVAQRDGDTVHLREQAWFALDIQHDPLRALQLAAQNWQQQREPADVRLYWRAARAAGSMAANAALGQWLAATQYEDATLLSRPSAALTTLRRTVRR
jgi:tetratricopeptide (TPR) repeat protein